MTEFIFGQKSQPEGRESGSTTLDDLDLIKAMIEIRKNWLWLTYLSIQELKIQQHSNSHDHEDHSPTADGDETEEQTDFEDLIRECIKAPVNIYDQACIELYVSPIGSNIGELISLKSQAEDYHEVWESSNPKEVELGSDSGATILMSHEVKSRGSRFDLHNFLIEQKKIKPENISLIFDLAPPGQALRIALAEAQKSGVGLDPNEFIENYIFVCNQFNRFSNSPEYSSRKPISIIVENEIQKLKAIYSHPPEAKPIKFAEKGSPHLADQEGEISRAVKLLEEYYLEATKSTS